MIRTVQIDRDAAGWLVRWSEGESGESSPALHERRLSAADQEAARREAAAMLGVSLRSVLD